MARSQAQFSAEIFEHTTQSWKIYNGYTAKEMLLWALIQTDIFQNRRLPFTTLHRLPNGDIMISSSLS